MHFTPKQIRMPEFGLVSGQTVSAAMQLPIMEANMRAMQAAIALADAVKA